ncbi:MAG: type IV pilus secretin PilQ [Thermodesulfovibrionales bacterium]
MRPKIDVPVLLLLLLLLCTSAYAKENAGREKTREITALEVLDNAVAVTVDGPVVYTVHRPGDPFRVLVDLEGVSLGRFREKIFSDRAGITEVAPTQIQSPAVLSRLNILLQSPSTVVPELKGNRLVLRVQQEEKKGAAATDGSRGTTAELPALQAAPADTAEEEGDADEDEDDDGAGRITAVLLNKTARGAEIIIRGDGALPDPSVFEAEKKLIIDIPGVIMGASLPSVPAPPVQDIRYRVQENRLRITIELTGALNKEIVTIDDELRVSLYAKGAAGEKQETAAGAPRAGFFRLGEEGKGGARLISLDFQDADIIPILRLLSDVSGYNIVVHPDVKGKITMKLMNVPWDQALDIILRTFNLEKVVEGNVIRIATVKSFQEERKTLAETREVFGKAEEIVTRILVVNYANVEKVKDSLEKAKVLSPRGSLSTDTRTRSLIVKDIPSVLEEIQRIVTDLDKPTPQVLIEARIVEVNTNYSRSLGVEWGASLSSTNRLTTASGSVSGSSVTGGNSSNTTMINLPATTSGSTVPTSAITIGYLNAAQTLGLDLRLSAIEAMGKAKLLSTPKIMTLENEQALIRHGKKIPVTTPGTTQGTFTTVYIDANLKLVVTPQVAPDGTVLLKLEVNKDEPDFNRKDTLGNPAIDTRAASTQVLVKDSETVVIGGILKGSETADDSKVPGISDVPILGMLFKKQTKETTSEELLIFITPRIVK